MRPIAGAFAPVPTPLTADDRLDGAALQRHLRWLAHQGLDGALILGTNGEFPSFSLEERRVVAEAAVASGADLCWLLNIGSCAAGEVLELLAVAVRCGYDGVLCPPPFYFRSATTSGVAAFFRRVLDASALPVLLYNIPQLTGIAISDALLDELGDHPRLAGVKDSSGDTAELTRLCCRFRADSYLVGHDRLTTAAYAAGGRGSITAAASIAPRLVSSLVSEPALQTQLDAVRAVLDAYGLGPAVKAILRHLGFGAYTTRPPLLGLAREQQAHLLASLGNIGFSLAETAAVADAYREYEGAGQS